MSVACQLPLSGLRVSRADSGLLMTGYYNTCARNGYEPLLAVLSRHNARVSFTCVEMRDCEHPPEAHCSPQGAPLWSRYRAATTSRTTLFKPRQAVLHTTASFDPALGSTAA